ncbi:MAG: dihydrofolate reductase [Saprospiraceae bacterium]|nr:dihydrofolate reductase [Saprospiraceae bacterium]
MKFKLFILTVLVGSLYTSCKSTGSSNMAHTDHSSDTYDSTFQVAAQEFADLKVLRYQVPGFNQLPLNQKLLAYYLSQAALSGRDIIYDQFSRNGLTIRKTIEAIYSTYTGDKTTDDWKKFEVYCGRVWFSNGNHHHYGKQKFFPEISTEYFDQLVKSSDAKKLPLASGEDVNSFLARIKPILFDPKIEPKLVDLSPNIDNVKASSVNFYQDVNQQDVENFYSKFDSKGHAPMWGLNSQLVKKNGKVEERVWKLGGMYSPAIEKIIYWLEKAVTVAENPQQKKTLELLIQYYKTGDLHTFDDYSIAWINDTSSRVDAVNGFIEVYEDPIGRKATFESVVSIKDLEATKRIAAIAKEAQWFEDHSPLMPEHKKKNVKGIIAKAITVVMEAGATAPSGPIGINLPNNEWIRKEHGSKSVSLSNIIHSYNVDGATSGMLDEFGVNDEVKARIKKYGNLTSDLHTDMHEAIGHASGQINPGVETTDKTLKNYASTLEEARADLVALYYMIDQKLVDIGVLPNVDAGKAEYDSYMMNGLMTQLVRIEPGHDLEEAHMRNRQLVAKWAYEKGKADNVVEFVKKNGKTYVRINDYNKLRELFGQLLREIQRVKSEGDYEAGKNLVENYGVKVDPVLHKEVLDRYKKLNIKPYKGFIQPRYVPVMDGDKIIDVKVEYPDNFFAQMLEYGEKYSFLPLNN